MLKSLFNKLNTLAIALCCIALLATSCSDDDIAALAVWFDSPTTLALPLGETQTLKAIVVPTDATNQNVKWKSSDTSVATVSATGEIEPKTVGEATITVTTVDGGHTATCVVTVVPEIIRVTGVSLNKTVTEVFIGPDLKETLVATITPSNATVKTVTWRSNDNAIATVNELGEVEGKSVGTANITATTTDGSFVATCVVSVDAASFKVTFETNGGTEIADIDVPKGDKLTRPADPTKAGGADEGLYQGVVDPNIDSLPFGGWYTDQACTIAYDFDTPVTNTLKLYALWSGSVSDPIDLTSATGNTILEKAYRYLSTLALTEKTEFTLVLDSDVTVTNDMGDFGGSNVILTLIGKGQERVVSKTVTGNFFVVNAGTFIFSKNIKLTGTNVGGFHLLRLNGGNAIQKEGSRFADATGCTGHSGVVFINANESTFTMEGGEICNNTVRRTAANIMGGAVTVNWGTFEMKGGVIHSNKAITDFATHHIAGAVYVSNNRIFIKTGGVIRDNVAEATVTRTAGMAQAVFFNSNNTTTLSATATRAKVDANLGEDDNLSTEDLTNPLWQEAN